MHPFDQLISTFSASGKQFEVLCKWILETDPTYANMLEKVWLWDDWPGNWGIDKGTDLVAQDTDGRIWAIQAKHYSPNYSITYTDIKSHCSGQVILATSLWLIQYFCSDSFGDNPPLC
jgi:predicted helicase